MRHGPGFFVILLSSADHRSPPATYRTPQDVRQSASLSRKQHHGRLNNMHFSRHRPAAPSHWHHATRSWKLAAPGKASGSRIRVWNRDQLYVPSIYRYIPHAIWYRYKPT
jgi:hypothetical protein